MMVCLKKAGAKTRITQGGAPDEVVSDGLAKPGPFPDGSRFFPTSTLQIFLVSKKSGAKVNHPHCVFTSRSHDSYDQSLAPLHGMKLILKRLNPPHGLRNLFLGGYFFTIPRILRPSLTKNPEIRPRLSNKKAVGNIGILLPGAFSMEVFILSISSFLENPSTPSEPPLRPTLAIRHNLRRGMMA